MLRFNRNAREPSLIWPDNYYLETNAKVREDILKSQLEKDPSKENLLRYQLWKKRYTLPGKGITGVDYYMKLVLSMELTAEKRNSLFGKKSFRKELGQIRDIFCLDQLKEFPDYAHLWKDEFLNFWSLYIEVCREDKNYTGELLGLGRISGERLTNKLKNDMEQKAVILPEKLGLSDDLSLFGEAAREAFCYYFP